jgi:hypothetical protein
VLTIKTTLALTKSQWLIEAMLSQPRQLRTFDAVVAELGGLRAVAQLTKQDTAAVCNWKRRRSRFPTKYYILMKDELDARGAEAPLDLWGFVLGSGKR